MTETQFIAERNELLWACEAAAEALAEPQPITLSGGKRLATPKAQVAIEMLRAAIEKHKFGMESTQLDQARKHTITIAEAIRLLRKIVCVEGDDCGVILLSAESPTTWNPAIEANVYQHENFSPLGNALVKLHSVLIGQPS